VGSLAGWNSNVFFVGGGGDVAHSGPSTWEISKLKAVGIQVKSCDEDKFAGNKVFFAIFIENPHNKSVSYSNYVSTKHMKKMCFTTVISVFIQI